MANFFDQFDGAPEAQGTGEAPVAAPTVAPPRIAPSAPTSAAPATAAPGNFFDQFDETPAPQETGPKSEWDVDWNAAAKNAAARASYSAWGTPGDLAGLIGQPIVTTIDVLAGTNLRETYRPALGSEWLAERAKDWFGLENPYSPEGKSRAQRYAEAAAEFAALFALPSPTAKVRMGKIASEYGAELVQHLPPTVGDDVRRAVLELMGGAGPDKLKSVGDVGRVAGAATMGAAAGVGAEAAQEFAPEPLKPTAALAGSFAGAAGVAGAGAGAGVVTRGVGEYLRPAAAALGSKKATDRLAAQSVQQAAADPSRAAETIGETVAPEGVEFTAGQAANDAGLLALEQTLARSKDQDFRVSFLERAREQNRALANNLRRLGDGAPAADAANFFASRMAELRERADRLNTDARELAEARASFNVPEAAEVGGNLQNALEAEKVRVRDEIAAMDRAIDPDGKMTLPTQALKGRVDEMYARMSPEERLSLTPEERAIVDIVRSYGDTLPYRNFRSLRTQINEDMREARRAGKNQAYGRLSQLRGALEQDVDAAVTGRFAEDARVADEAVRRARDWYEKGAAGNVAAAGAVTGAEAPAPGVPRSAGAGSGAQRLAAAAARDTGLPPDADRGTVASVPFVLTNRTRQALRDLGYSDQQIKNMTPAEGNRLVSAGDRPDADRGARAAVEGSALDQAANDAATSPANALREPTEAQQKAGNYAKGHAKIGGLDLSIENPAGSTRRGADRTGKPWSVAMKDHYGYIRGTVGRDKDHIDTFVKAGTEALDDAAPVFVVDQIDPRTGKFDEHKVMLGYANRAEAEGAYSQNYAKGWRGMGTVTELPLGGLKRWLKEGNTKRPLGQQRTADMFRDVEGRALSGKLSREQIRAYNRAADAKKWVEADLPVDRIIATQDTVNKDFRQAAGRRAGQRDGYERPLVVRADGKNFAADGHHRIAAAIDRGDKTIPVRFLDLDRIMSGDMPDPRQTTLFQKAPPTSSPAFKRWFKDSKVVDAEGKPLVVYHGTNAEFEAFDPRKVGSAYGIDERGFYFTSSRGQAQKWAEKAPKATSPKVVPAYLSMQRPWEINAPDGRSPVEYFESGEGVFDRGQQAAVEYGISSGYDGMIIRGADETMFVAFDPTQIKSTANRGTFDPKDPRILYQGDAAAPTFYSATLRAVEGSKTGRATADQWMATIRNTPGVKAEELDWIGLEPWLKSFSPEIKVSREKVEEFIRANQIEVEETDLTGVEVEADLPRYFDWEPDDVDEDFVREVAAERAADEADDYRERIARNEDIEPEEVTDEQIEQLAFEDEMRFREQEPDGYHTSVTLDTPNGSTIYDINRDSSGYTNIYNNEYGGVADGQMDDADIRQNIKDHFEEAFGGSSGGYTQYGEYTLPGGDDYHELLMRLPERTGRQDTRPSAEVQAKYKDQWDALVAEQKRNPYDVARHNEISDELTRLHERMVEETRATRAPWKSGENFDAPHFEDVPPNILAHVRFKTRRDADGKKTLMLEEVQSDWHQQGREKGYRQKPGANAEKELQRLVEIRNGADEAVRAAKLPIMELRNALSLELTEARRANQRERWEELDKQISDLRAQEDAILEGPLGQAREAAHRSVDAMHRDLYGGVPDAPFKTTWPELAMKRMIRWAAENGYDQIAWTPGSVQNKRYSLSTHVDTIEWKPMPGDGNERQVAIHPKSGRYVRLQVDPSGKVVEAPQADWQGKMLSEVVGKDVADKIMSERQGEMSGDGLEIGGGGMTGFYDKMLVSIGNKLGKKFGSKVGRASVPFGSGYGDSSVTLPDGRKVPGIEAHTLPITEEMRKSAMHGMPLFQKQRNQIDEAAAPDDRGAGVRPLPRGSAAPEGNAGREADGSLRGLPRKVGAITASAYPDAQRVAADYMKAAGLEYRPPNTYAKVVPERASRIASAYDAMEHNPSDPAVQRAYRAMIDETLAQYQAMLDDGMKIEFIGRDQPDPYAGNPRNMTEDVRRNKHMWVFSTKDGFGSDASFDPVDNPLLAETPYQISGQPALANDIFRAVHDYFGHVKEGVGFRADGEENAWRAHSAMYSPEARKAMTTETRGQNSWVNYGPFGERNRTARSEDTHYADQKIGILPDWVISEGAGDEAAGIADTITSRVEAAGRSPEEAKAAGAMVDSFYTTMAQRAGVPVEQLVGEFPLPAFEKGGGRGAMDQPAWHGSPHIFGKFEWNDRTRGKGEGSQSFGDGLYFAGRKEVAQFYRDSLTANQQYGQVVYTVGGKEVTPGTHDAAAASIAHWANTHDVTPGRLREEVFARGDDWRPDIFKRVRQMRKKGVEDKVVRGRLYKADVPDDAELMLWDAPLSEQPTAVRSAISKLMAGPLFERSLDAETGWQKLSGEKFYGALAERVGGYPQASAALREAGIPGHRFLDQGSRKPGWRVLAPKDSTSGKWVVGQAPNGPNRYFDTKAEADAYVADVKAQETYNYVIYDDSRVKITEFEQNKGEGPRGSIRFGDTGNLISLFEKADPSTVQHELAHHYLEMYRSMAGKPGAPEPLAKDWSATQAWWQKNARELSAEAGAGVTAKDVRDALRGKSLGAAKEEALWRAMHEQWARAFETYLRDGKAPNSKLRAVFEQFKQWLTDVYRNFADLGVKMTPEIRQVFDRMLGAEAPGATRPEFGAQAARQLKDVTGRWKDYYRTYTDKSSSPVPAMLRKSQGESYPFDMQPEAVARAAWKKGPEGAAAIRSMMDGAGRNRAEVRQAIEQSAALSLARAAVKNNVLDPAAFDRWRAAHSDALRALPELDRRLSSAADASREMLRIGKVTADAIAAAEKSAAGEILKLGPSPSDADISRKVGQMLGRQNAVKTMRELMAEAKGDPTAIEGLRSAVVDHIMSRFGAGPEGEGLRAGHMATWIGKNRAALEQVLSPEQMRSIDAVVRAHERIANIIRAPGGGSPTSEYLTALAERGQSPSMLAEMIRQGAINAMQSGAAGAVHAWLGGGGAGLNTAVGAFLTKSGLDALRARGFTKADDLIKEAIMDPQLMRALLMKPTKRKGEGSARAFERAVFVGGMRGLLEGARGNPEPRREPEYKRTPPKVLTPMLGVRG